MPEPTRVEVTVSGNLYEYQSEGHTRWVIDCGICQQRYESTNKNTVLEQLARHFMYHHRET